MFLAAPVAALAPPKSWLLGLFQKARREEIALEDELRDIWDKCVEPTEFTVQKYTMSTPIDPDAWGEWGKLAGEGRAKIKAEAMKAIFK